MFERSLLVLALLLAGCGSTQKDSLATEKASMEAEAKALAQHQTRPAPAAAEPGQPAGKPAASERKPENRLPAGTPIKAITTMSLSSRSAAIAQEWTGRLAEDIVDANGKVVAKAGSDLKGRVALVSDGTNLRRKHELEIRVFQVLAPGGQPVDVHTTSFVREGADKGTRPAIIENESKIDFQLASSAVFPN